MAIILNSYQAKNLDAFDHVLENSEDSDAVGHVMKRLGDLALQHTLPSSAAKPVSEANAVQNLKRKLQELGLHEAPVLADSVFRHEPAQNIVQEKRQEAVLRKFGLFLPLELGWQHTRPW